MIILAIGLEIGREFIPIGMEIIMSERVIIGMFTIALLLHLYQLCKKQNIKKLIKKKENYF
jgi:hypothetical protein